MEKENLENIIKQKLDSRKLNLDKDSLWAELEPKLPPQKSKPVFPLWIGLGFLLFLVGISTYYFLDGKDSKETFAENKNVLIKDSNEIQSEKKLEDEDQTEEEFLEKKVTNEVLNNNTQNGKQTPSPSKIYAAKDFGNTNNQVSFVNNVFNNKGEATGLNLSNIDEQKEVFWTLSENNTQNSSLKELEERVSRDLLSVSILESHNGNLFHDRELKDCNLNLAKKLKTYVPISWINSIGVSSMFLFNGRSIENQSAFPEYANLVNESTTIRNGISTGVNWKSVSSIGLTFGANLDYVHIIETLRLDNSVGVVDSIYNSEAFASGSNFVGAQQNVNINRAQRVLNHNAHQFVQFSPRIGYEIGDVWKIGAEVGLNIGLFYTYSGKFIESNGLLNYEPSELFENKVRVNGYVFNTYLSRTITDKWSLNINLNYNRHQNLVRNPSFNSSINSYGIGIGVSTKI